MARTTRELIAELQAVDSILDRKLGRVLADELFAINREVQLRSGPSNFTRALFDVARALRDEVGGKLTAEQVREYHEKIEKLIQTLR